MKFDFDTLQEEDSPYPEVRASVSNIDDPDMPVLTLRMWLIGLLLSLTARCVSSSSSSHFISPHLSLFWPSQCLECLFQLSPACASYHSNRSSSHCPPPWKVSILFASYHRLSPTSHPWRRSVLS